MFSPCSHIRYHPCYSWLTTGALLWEVFYPLQFLDWRCFVCD